VELTMLEARALSIGYGARLVASGIRSRSRAREVLCLLGRTARARRLVQDPARLIPARGGEIRPGGQAIEALTRTEMARAMAYVPQAQTMSSAYTVLDLVLMGRTAHLGPFAAPRAVDRERARAALADLGILGLRTPTPTHLRRPAPALPRGPRIGADARSW